MTYRWPFRYSPFACAVATFQTVPWTVRTAIRGGIAPRRVVFSEHICRGLSALLVVLPSLLDLTDKGVPWVTTEPYVELAELLRALSSWLRANVPIHRSGFSVCSGNPLPTYSFKAPCTSDRQLPVSWARRQTLLAPFPVFPHSIEYRAGTHKRAAIDVLTELRPATAAPP